MHRHYTKLLLHDRTQLGITRDSTTQYRNNREEVNKIHNKYFANRKKAKKKNTRKINKEVDKEIIEKYKSKALKGNRKELLIKIGVVLVVFLVFMLFFVDKFKLSFQF